MVNEPQEVEIPTDRPTSARVYGYMLGGKDNFEVDRQYVLSNTAVFREGLDLARQNRQFLYRVVRFLAAEAGIGQFLDMGCGLPTDNNVHQVAQEFDPQARVVYVDNDPIVLTHGRALLGNTPNTTVITADMRDTQAILDHPDVGRLIDFDQPLAVLYLSVGHHLTDADDPRRILGTVIDRAVPDSFLVFSQVVSDDAEQAAQLSEFISANGIPWQTRTPTQVDALLDGLEPVEPGLGNVKDWRPDPDQPPLAPLDPALEPMVGESEREDAMYEYGGVLRKL